MELMLYYRPGCPFCGKVLDFLNEHQRSVPQKNIQENNTAREELLQAGGKAQVPCLMINGKALYESSDIIDWVKKHLEVI